MPDRTKQLSALVIKEVISIWKECDPVEGYAAGFDDCKGKLFFPTDAAKADLSRRIGNARSRLAEIQDDDLRTVSNKLLSSISVGVAFESPDEQVLTCAVALWYSMLKGEQTEPFVGKLLEQSIEIVNFDHSRWRGHKFSGETRQACLNACSLMESILIILAGENRKEGGRILALYASVGNFRSLFSFPVQRPGNFEELLAFFEANTQRASENKVYPQIIDHMLDYGVSIEHLYKGSKEMLAEELGLARETASRLSAPLDITPGASLGEAYQMMSKRYEITGQIVAEARKMMKALNRFVDKRIQDLGFRPNILPEATPAFLKPLVTSGGTIALDYIKKAPRTFIYVTEEKTTSWLTLLNVLVHEAAHAYHPVILSVNPSVPLLTKLKSWLAVPFYEATAFHRELELFEAIKEDHYPKRGLDKELKELLTLFDTPQFPLRDDILAFELETRVWRIIRALRSICDIEVNSGKRTYVGFIKWASAHTGLSKEFIHNECFTFLANPGYTPSYSFCGSQYNALQREAKEQREVSRLAFNTQANRMGLLPWTLCVKKMGEFLP